MIDKALSMKMLSMKILRHQIFSCITYILSPSLVFTISKFLLELFWIIKINWKKSDFKFSICLSCLGNAYKCILLLQQETYITG